MVCRTDAPDSPLPPRGRGFFGAAVIALLLWLLPALAHAAEPVVLLHGLARTPASMQPMAEALRAEGYRVCNLGYPSRHYPVGVLAREHVAPQIARCFPGHSGPVHFVTHSMGGILVRQLAADGRVRIGRVVMLGPPNQGSEVVDALGDTALFRALNGPAGAQLGAAAPLPLADARGFELGVIAGSRSINWGLSLLIPGEDDGKVAVARTRLAGMRDFRVIACSHPFLPRDREAIAETLHFLRHGSFRAARAGQPRRRRRAEDSPVKASISASQYSE